MYTIMCISGNSATVFHEINLDAIVTGVLEFYISILLLTTVNKPLLSEVAVVLCLFDKLR